MGKWKYPQWVILALVAVVSIQALIEFGSPADYVEVYCGKFGPWTLRFGVEEKARPGEKAALVAWISSPSGRPNYKALRARLLAGAGPASQTELTGSVYESRGLLPLPPEASAEWRIQLDAELWNSERIRHDFPLAAILQIPAGQESAP